MGQQARTSPSAGPFPGFTIRDGRYLGSDGRWWVEVRVDARGCGMISCDLHTSARGGTQLVRLSGSTNRSDPIDPDVGAWFLTWVTDGEHEVQGWLRASAVRDVPDTYHLRFHVPAGLGGDVDDLTLSIRTSRVGDALRTLSLEVELEEGVVPPRAVVIEGESITAEACLRQAGFDLGEVGVSSVIPKPDGGSWNGADVLERLNTAMTGAAQASLSEEAWEAHLLLLSKSDREGLLGVMFDLDTLPRQGCAVFVDEIRARIPAAEAESRVVQAVVHELGHVLNLSHRFLVGAWDSTSFMNYRSFFEGGGRESEYDKLFSYRFDPDELAFLRHGSRFSVIPGGASFGSEAYWVESVPAPGQLTTRAAQASGRETAAQCLRLWLTPSDEPNAEGLTEVPLGQPVFLTVSLGNAGYRPVVVPRFALDVKSGLLELAVRRLDGAEPSPGAQRFIPVMRRCQDLVTPRLVRLAAGQSLHDNVNLAAATTGDLFAEPGRYEVTPALIIPAGDLREPGDSGNPGDSGKPGSAIRVVGPAIQLRIAEPADGTTAELLAPKVASGVAVGSFTASGAHTEAVKALLERPLVARTAAVARTMGLEVGRKASAMASQGRFGGEQEFRRAAELLDRATTGQAGSAFDPHTSEHTQRLAHRYAVQAGEAAARIAPSVIIDLRTTPASDGSTGADGAGTSDGTASQVAGCLQVDDSGDAWEVLLPADTLPPSVMDQDTPTHVEAVVTIAGPDGLTERMTASEVLLVGPSHDKKPQLARLTLPRPVPGLDPTPLLDRHDPEALRITEGRTFWQVLAAQGIAPGDLDEQASQPLGAWSAAASGALKRHPMPQPAPQADVRIETESQFDLVAWRIGCLLLHCGGQDGPPQRFYDPLRPSSTRRECLDPQTSPTASGPTASSPTGSGETGA